MQPADVQRLVAPNPGPMTLEGTNTYVVGRDPAVVVDPGPDDSRHIEAILEVTEARGGIGTVLLTHSHRDHSGGVEALGIEPASLQDDREIAGLTAIATPGHAQDHFCFLLPQPRADATAGPAAYACFTGDLILGEGSTIVGPREMGGSLADYMRSLEKLRKLDLTTIYPGHGPEVTDPEAKIAEYIEHRMMRERRLVTALERGERSKAALLAEVWDDVPEQLRGAAAIAMQAHLEKLEDEGRPPTDLRD
ncbi:MAG TPA: MBL fold metallo-hydrolase [Solirubrobacterales bacterium]|nr:MBL fold metallo-hydrolase [Solirubrobacterales bacterium]